MMDDSIARDYEEKDPGFINDLRESKVAVNRAADWLSSMGYPVIIRPTFERPNSAEMNEYSDDGDLEILQRIEVKRRKSLTFTSKEDFPYPSLIVDVCHCYDNARPKPYKYIILNKEMTCAFVVDCKTYKHWVRVEKQDRFKGRERKFYECPMSFVSFMELDV